MTSRRGFLGLLAAAPVALPVLAKEALASGGYVSGISGVIGGLDLTLGEFVGEPLQTLTMTVDTSHVRAALEQHAKEIAKMYSPDTKADMQRIAEGLRVRPPTPRRRGDWMQTSTGRQFWPLDPRPEEIHIEDIAAALSKLCRYGGHCRQFYSVAEHSVLMAHAAPDGLHLAALLHDASEAYLSDVIRPIKRHLANYGALERELERVIAQRFSLQHPMPAGVKALDEAIVVAEKVQAMLPEAAHDPLYDHVAPLPVQIQFWSPAKAEFEFLAAFRRYGGHWS